MLRLIQNFCISCSCFVVLADSNARYGWLPPAIKQKSSFRVKPLMFFLYTFIKLMLQTLCFPMLIF